MDEIDAFDLDSSNPASVLEFEGLESRYRDAAGDLIEFVFNKRDRLIASLWEDRK